MRTTLTRKVMMSILAGAMLFSNGIAWAADGNTTEMENVVDKLIAFSVNNDTPEEFEANTGANPNDEEENIKKKIREVIKNDMNDSSADVKGTSSIAVGYSAVAEQKGVAIGSAEYTSEEIDSGKTIYYCQDQQWYKVNNMGENQGDVNDEEKKNLEEHLSKWRNFNASVSEDEELDYSGQFIVLDRVNGDIGRSSTDFEWPMEFVGVEGGKLIYKATTKAEHYGVAIGTKMYAGESAVAIGNSAGAFGKNSVYIGERGGTSNGADNSVAIGSSAVVGVNSPNSMAIGDNANVYPNVSNSIAFGSYAIVSEGTNSVALGAGSVADRPNVISVGSGNSDSSDSTYPATRSIINVTDIAKAAGFEDDQTIFNISTEIYGSYAVNLNTLKKALEEVQQNAGNAGSGVTGISFDYDNGKLSVTNAGDTTTDIELANWADKKYATLEIVGIVDNNSISSYYITTNLLKDKTSLIAADIALDKAIGDLTKLETSNTTDLVAAINEVYVMVNEGGTSGGGESGGTAPSCSITAGDNISVTENNNEFTVSLNDDISVNKVDANEINVSESLKIGDKTTNAVSFSVDDGSVKINMGNNKINGVAAGELATDSQEAVNGRQLYKEQEAREAADKQHTDDIEANREAIVGNSEAISSLNQRLGKLDGKINKVGAGAAALAALHPMDFDPDDKLSFAAGVGNYAGENATALGVFYRPNEKVMMSVGGTYGNGENMVNMGVSFALDKTNNVSNSRVAMAREIMELRENAVKQQQALARQDAQIAQLVALVNQLTGNAMTYEVSKNVAFPDIPENHWAYEYVHSLAAKGLLEGYPDGTFAGDRVMTRYEFAAMLFRAMQKGAVLSDAIKEEFKAELGRIRVDRLKGEDGDANKTERVRVNNYADRDDYGSKVQ